MRMRTAAMTLAAMVGAAAAAAPQARAQGPGAGPRSGRGPAVAVGGVPAVDSKVLKSADDLPKPDASGTRPPVVNLPAEPIDPFLLQPEHGPFMVNAYVFRDPNAAKMAQALCMELRAKHGLPAYVWFMKVHPLNSNIRNIPPTAPPPVRNGEMTAPERFRTYDEAAVLVGNCKSTAESLALLKQVKKIRPDCLNGETGAFAYLTRKSLGRAMMTQNPLVPSQALYPGRQVAPIPGTAPHGPHGPAVAKNGQAIDLDLVVANFERNKKADPLVKSMNDRARSPHSIYNCPGAYTMPVFTFTGNATTFVAGQGVDSRESGLFSGESALKSSPLSKAADDAEAFADTLERCNILHAAGFRPYVYHTRSSSQVCIGAFHTADDPRANDLLKIMDRLCKEILEKAAKADKKGGVLLPTPATTLLAVPKG